jgi:hypothetical protein
MPAPLRLVLEAEYTRKVKHALDCLQELMARWDSTEADGETAQVTATQIQPQASNVQSKVQAEDPRIREAREKAKDLKIQVKGMIASLSADNAFASPPAEYMQKNIAQITTAIPAEARAWMKQQKQTMMAFVDKDKHDWFSAFIDALPIERKESQA